MLRENNRLFTVRRCSGDFNVGLCFKESHQSTNDACIIVSKENSDWGSHIHRLLLIMNPKNGAPVHGPSLRLILEGQHRLRNRVPLRLTETDETLLSRARLPHYSPATG